MAIELQAATKTLYGTFARYPLRPKMDGCPCCVSDADKAKLHLKPFAQLIKEDLDQYTVEAMTTWGDVADFKHFLPRILEFLALSGQGTNTWLVFEKLHYGNWQHWPKDEVNAVTECLMRWWTEQINRKPYADVTLFNSFHRFLGDIEPLLTQWHITFEDTSFQNLITFIESETPELMRRKGHYKDMDEAAIRKLECWLVSHLKIIEQGFYRYKKSDTAWAERIAFSYDT